MNQTCECQNYPFQSILAKGYDKTQEEVQSIVVDFGEVLVHGNYKKTITEDLGNKEAITYEINEEPDITPIYQSFKFNKTGGVVASNDTLKLKIYYSPVLPHRKDISTFVVSLSTRRTIKVICKGVSIAPVLRASCKEISFVTWPQGGSRKKRLDVKNESQVPAEFQFDCDRVPEVFKVEPKHGIIKPNRHIFVTITYLPTSPGIFSEQIFCLVLGCEPLTFELIGLHGRGPVDEKEINLKSYNYEFDAKVGYGAYFRPIVRAAERKSLPPVYLDSPFIDFGRISPSDGVTTYKTFRMKNTLGGYIDVTWPKDKDVFMIKPQRTQIPPGYSVLSQCWFEPNKEYTMFNKTITCQIDWKIIYDDPAPLNYCVPMNLNITLQGNSYAEEEYPIARIEIIPKTIKFPPCLPGLFSHQNFKIRNDSHMSAMFCLIAPEDSKIIVRPALGIVKDYAIVSAQFAADCDCEGVYVETWELEINGDSKTRMNVKFVVAAGTPTVRVGEENYIRFDTSPPGTISTLTASLRNLSSFHLKYQLGSHPFLTANIESGQLLPHDQVMLTFKCKADLYNQKKTSATFDLQVIEKIKQFVGLQYTHQFTVYTDCAPSELCAIPKSHDFMELRFGSSLETEFYLFNFGNCSVRFKLNCENRSHGNDTYKLQPRSGEVKPKEKVKVTVTAPHVKSPGLNVVAISYGTEGQEDLEAKEVFTFIYHCLYPEIKVIDIIDYTFGHLFSKDYFWKALRITRLNGDLKNIKENETKVLDVYLPDCEAGKREYHVVLLIANVASFDMTACLKRIKLCDCTTKQVQTTINKTKLEFDCPHREMLTMKLDDTVIYGNSRQFLTITAKYSVIGATKLAYSLDIGDNRRIEFFFNMKVLTPRIPKISFYSQANTTFRMLPIFVGRKEPPIQAFWMYNNTSESAKYEANLNHVKELCEKEGFPVLKLLNPEGEIEPYSNAAFLIKFHPIRAKVHKVKISLQLEEEHVLFKVIGMGRNSRTKKPFIPRAPYSTSEFFKLPVMLSHNYIRIDPMLTWNVQTRMIFIKNCSNDVIYQFDFPGQTISGVIKITANPTFGFLKPKETQTVIITVKTFNEPAILNYNYTCYIMNYNALFLHRKTMYKDAAAEDMFFSLIKTMNDMIRTGSTLPNIALYEDSPDKKVFLSKTVVGKRVVIIGVPGAFTPECSTVHLPGYVNNADILKQQGIDEIICISVNDPFVMKAWSDKQKASGKVRLLADTSAEFTLALGLACELPVLGGVRSRRYSMVVYNEKVVHLKVEVDTTSLKCSLVEALEFPNLNII